ncbi:MAG: AMP-binding protein [Myxococcales bacterium]|nr:AMP-binding protein [Myxococcales bacterium]
MARWRSQWRPERPAVSLGSLELSYGQLSTRLDQARAVLRGRGVAFGDVVALMMPRSVDVVVWTLACLADGVVVLPLNVRYTAPEVAYLLADAAPRLAVLPAAHHDAGPPGGCLTPEEAAAAVDGAEPVVDDRRVSGSAPSLLMYTSGTTGRPKGALHTHDSVGATVEALHQAWRWSEGDVLLHALPLTHVHGLVVAAFGALRAGATCRCVQRFDAADVAARLHRGEATVFMGVPTFYNRLATAPGTFDWSRVRLLTSGSAPLSADTHQRIQERFGHAIVERYGMTEVGIVFSNPYERRVPGSIGLPLPGITAQVTDPDTLEPVEAGEAGELWVRGPSLFVGYRGLPEQTREAVVDGWMRTGDLARRGQDGFVVLLGRRGDMILRGGFNVYPAEVEGALREHRAVRDVAVVGLPHADLGQTVAAAVVGPEVSDQELLEFARARLAPYKVPAQILRLEELPRNTMGKVLKRELRGMFRASGGST